MSRIGRSDHEAFLQVTQQRLLAHDAQYPLVIDCHALSRQGMRDPSIAIAGKLEDDALDLIA